MATTSTIVNEVTVTGRVYRRLVDKTAKLWQRISYWTKASDVEFDDGKTAQDKVGNINGITSDFSLNDENICASSLMAHKAHERFYEFTDNGRIISIKIGTDGKPYIVYKDGADTVSKKLGEPTIIKRTYKFDGDYFGTHTSINIGKGYYAVYVISVGATCVNSIGSGEQAHMYFNYSYDTSTGILKFDLNAPNVGGLLDIAMISY